MKHLKLFEQFEDDPFGEEIDNNPMNSLISEICSKVEKWGGYITMGDMYVDESPVYKSYMNEIHLIEAISTSGVDVVAYSGYKYDTRVNEYEAGYSELSFETLIYIKKILDDAIEGNLLDNGFKLLDLEDI